MVAASDRRDSGWFRVPRVPVRDGGSSVHLHPLLMMAATTGRGRAWLGKLAALAASAVIAAVMIEVYVRVSGRDQPVIWQPDPVLGWRHIPGTTAHWYQEGEGWIEINSLGMRDPERTIAKPSGTFRIAVFGDSMTEAVQVYPAQTYCHLLESRLR